MPCDMGMSSSNYDSEARRRGDEAARVACDLLKAIEALGEKGVIPKIDDLGLAPQTRRWLDDHKRQDAAREAAEAAQRHRAQIAMEAYAKLTPEERAALGLRGLL